jgi:hypothetical protein
LVIHSSAFGARIFGSIFITIGGFFVVGVVWTWIESLMRGQFRFQNDGIGGLVFLALGSMFGIPGVIICWRAKNTDYHFEAKLKRLVVRNRRGETVVPFSVIKYPKVAVSSGASDTDTFGLELVLHDQARELKDGANVIYHGGGYELFKGRIPPSIEMTHISSSGTEGRCSDVAQRINKMLKTSIEGGRL